MGEKGPCSHCGVEYSPLWRSGPKGEPTLCNACGLRWRTRGDLQNYTPNINITRGNGVKVTIGDKSNTLRGSHKSDGDASSGGSTFSSLDKNIKLESGSGHKNSGISPPDFLDCHIPRKKRSKLDQVARTPVGVVEGLQRKLLHILHQPEFAYLREEQEELLITQNNQISSGEIGLGCVLLKSPDSDSKNEK